jgi:hypothetical protein
MTKLMKIRVKCVDCGDLFVTSLALTVRACIDNQSWSYCFCCPRCGRATAHESDEPTVAPLVAIGVPVQRWHLPAELAEWRPGGPTLTPDDLLDFHLFMQRADWFADVVLDPRR